MKNINIQENADVKGNITSDWNSVRSGEYGKLQSSELHLTNINFGGNNNGTLDSTYSGSFSGNINGDTTYTESGSKKAANTLLVNLAGTLSLNDAIMNVYAVNNKGEMNVDGQFKLSTLNSAESIYGDGTINVNSGGEFNPQNTVKTINNTINIKNGGYLSTINNTQDNIKIQTLNSEAGGMLSFELGDIFNIENSANTSIDIGEVYITEDIIKNFGDNDQYKFFEDGSTILTLNGTSNIYYDGQRHTLGQDPSDNHNVSVRLTGAGWLEEAANDSLSSFYIISEDTQPKSGGSVNSKTFNVSGKDAVFTSGYNGMTVDRATNPEGTVVKTGFRGGQDYNLKVQNGGILQVDSSDKEISLGNDGEVALLLDNADVTLKAVNNNINIKGEIQGESSQKDNNLLSLIGSDFKLNKISSVTVENNANALRLNNISTDTNWKLNSGILNIPNDTYLSSDGTNSLTFNGGALNVANNKTSQINLESLELNSNANVAIDIDLSSKTADRFAFTNSGDVKTNGNKLVINGINYLNSNTKLMNESYPIQFIDSSLNNENLLDDVTLNTSTEVMTPIFKYHLGYQKLGSSGNLLLSRASTHSWQDYNPAIFAAQTSALVGGVSNQLNSYNIAFSNLDMLASLPEYKITAMKFKNKYAISDADKVLSFNPNQIPEERRGIWIKPYGTMEKVRLKNGPAVNNNEYGSYVGFDSDIIELGHNWNTVLTGYAGYNGSHQHYNGVSTYQNGGQIGFSEIFLRKRFFAGITANAGMSVADTSTTFGKEDFSMFLTGAAIKTGYNIGFLEDTLMIQPNVLAAYSLIDAENYTNASGMRIKSKPLNAMQLAPGIKLIGNLENDWQAYITAQMVFNFIGNPKFQIDDLALNKFSIKPYVQYGIGIQKRAGERFTGYLEAMGRNIGRDGVSLSSGMRWSVGRLAK